MPTVPLKYVVSFSSQDDKHPVTNLINGDGYKKWLCGAQDKSGQVEAVFQLEQPCVISYIDIGSIWCATLEIKVGRSDWPAGREFETLVYAVSLMTPMDCSYGKNPIKTQMFSPDVFCPDIAKQQWDRLKVVCRQPYKKSMQFGLSFLRVKTVSCVSASSKSGTIMNQESKPVPVKSIQRHFLEKIQNKQTDSKDALKTRLLKISASSDSGAEHGDSLSRTAKLVLAATGPKPKVYSSGSPAPDAKKAGLFSSHIDQKYGPKFEEEVQLFFARLDINAADLDSITLADVRHKFEKKKKRKLTKEEKRDFIAYAKEFLSNLFNNKPRQNTVTLDTGKTKLDIGNTKLDAGKTKPDTVMNVKAAESNNSNKPLDCKKNKDKSTSSKLKTTDRQDRVGDITPSSKRKLNSDDDRLTPPSKKFHTDRQMSMKQQMKNFEQSPSSAGGKPVIGQLNDRLTGKTCLNGYQSDHLSPVSPYQYKGLRGGDPDWNDDSSDPMAQTIISQRKVLDNGHNENISPMNNRENDLLIGSSNFGDFDISAPWSPDVAKNGNTTPCTRSGSLAKSQKRNRGQSSTRKSGRGSTRGRGRGQNRRRKLSISDAALNSDSENSDCTYEMNTSSPVVKGRGTGRGRGRKKSSVNSRSNTASLEIRPTGFAKCDGCNEYYGENLLFVHQGRCQRWQSLQSGSSGLPQSPWLSARPETPSSNSKTAKSGPTSAKTPANISKKKSDNKSVSENSSYQDSNSVRSPPWLLAAERRLQEQQKLKSSGNGVESSVDSDLSGSLSNETSPIIEIQRQELAKYQSLTLDSQAESSYQSYTNSQKKNDNQSVENQNSYQSELQTFGFSLGFSPCDASVDLTSDRSSNISDLSDIVGDDSVQVECPLCGGLFPRHIVEVHAATCFL